MSSGYEINVKCGAFSNTDDNLIKRNSTHTFVNIFEGFIVIQILTKAFYPVDLPTWDGSTPFF